jgi:hypothetical protein
MFSVALVAQFIGTGRWALWLALGLVLVAIACLVGVVGDMRRAFGD